VAFAAYAVVLTAIFLLNIHLGSAISSPTALANDLVSPADSPQDWNLNTSIRPFKYRVLFKTVVKGIWATLPIAHDGNTFYWTYVTLSFAFFWGAAVAFHVFLAILGFARWERVLGVLIFLLSAPVLLAYYVVVNTREDPLAYLLVLLSLIALVQDRPVAMCCLSILGAWTRETTLIVPLLYLVYAREAWPRRILLFALPVAAHVALRIYAGFGLNTVKGIARNLAYPVEAALFLFIAFGAFWFAAWLGYSRASPTADGPALGWLRRSAVLAVGLIVLTSVTMAKLRENRVVFMAFPWIVPLALTAIRRMRDPARRPGHAGWIRVWVLGAVMVAGLSFAGFRALPGSWNAQVDQFALAPFEVFASLHLGLSVVLFGLCAEPRTKPLRGSTSPRIR